MIYSRLLCSYKPYSLASTNIRNNERFLLWLDQSSSRGCALRNKCPSAKKLTQISASLQWALYQHFITLTHMRNEGFPIFLVTKSSQLHYLQQQLHLLVKCKKSTSKARNSECDWFLCTVFHSVGWMLNVHTVFSPVRSLHLSNLLKYWDIAGICHGQGSFIQCLQGLRCKTETYRSCKTKGLRVWGKDQSQS